MELDNYVAEAARALHLPEEFWPTVSRISFDLGDREWYSAYHVSGEMISAEAHAWVLRLIGWLQYKYPEGPALPEASCC